MLKIWGRLSSINVQKVVWTAAELGLPFERVDAGLHYGVVNTPGYLAMNPNALVPCIEDDGFTLWESGAIARYLAAKNAANDLWPSDPQARAIADQWMDWQTTTLTPAMGAAFMGLVRTPPDKRDAAAIENSARATEKHLRILDAHLATRAYVCGDAFTIGDIPVGLATHRWLHLPVERQSFPHIERWYRVVASRPAAKQAMVALT